MRPAATVRVQWTRAELLALREAIEVTPNFEGRQELRDFFRTAVRAHRMGPLELGRLASGAARPLTGAERRALLRLRDARTR